MIGDDDFFPEFCKLGQFKLVSKISKKSLKLGA